MCTGLMAQTSSLHHTHTHTTKANHTCGLNGFSSTSLCCAAGYNRCKNPSWKQTHTTFSCQVGHIINPHECPKCFYSLYFKAGFRRSKQSTVFSKGSEKISCTVERNHMMLQHLSHTPCMCPQPSTLTASRAPQQDEASNYLLGCMTIHHEETWAQTDFREDCWCLSGENNLVLNWILILWL